MASFFVRLGGGVGIARICQRCHGHPKRLNTWLLHKPKRDLVGFGSLDRGYCGGNALAHVSGRTVCDMHQHHMGGNKPDRSVNIQHLARFGFQIAGFKGLGNQHGQGVFAGLKGV